jgi:predicted nucleic acid-binding protein
VGRLAGELLGRAGSSNTVDAMVVAEAIEAGGATILTGDRDDLITLSARHPDVTIRAL